MKDRKVSVKDRIDDVIFFGPSLVFLSKMLTSCQMCVKKVFFFQKQKKRRRKETKMSGDNTSFECHEVDLTNCVITNSMKCGIGYDDDLDREEKEDQKECLKNELLAKIEKYGMGKNPTEGLCSAILDSGQDATRFNEYLEPIRKAFKKAGKYNKMKEEKKTSKVVPTIQKSKGFIDQEKEDQEDKMVELAVLTTNIEDGVVKILIPFCKKKGFACGKDHQVSRTPIVVEDQRSVEAICTNMETGEFHDITVVQNLTEPENGKLLENMKEVWGTGKFKQWYSENF